MKVIPGHYLHAGFTRWRNEAAKEGRQVALFRKMRNERTKFRYNIKLLFLRTFAKIKAYY